MDSQETSQPSAIPVARPRRRFLRVVLLFLIVALAAGATYRLVQPYLWKTWLARTCERADRVVLDLNTFPRRADRPSVLPVLPAVTIDDADSVRQLIDLIEFKPNWLSVLGGHCRCYGELKLSFFKGQQELQSVSFKHGQSLRSYPPSGPDMELTADSRAALAKWLDERGGIAFAKAQQEAKRRLAAWREEQNQEYSASTCPAGSAPSSTAAE